MSLIDGGPCDDTPVAVRPVDAFAEEASDVAGRGDGGHGGRICCAVPQDLIAYSTSSVRHDDELRRTAVDLSSALERLAASRPDPALLPPVPDLGHELLRFVDDKRSIDEWVGRVGRAFLAADHRASPSQPVTASLDVIERELAGFGTEPGLLARELVSALVEGSEAAARSGLARIQSQGLAEHVAAELRRLIDEDQLQMPASAPDPGLVEPPRIAMAAVASPSARIGSPTIDDGTGTSSASWEQLLLALAALAALAALGTGAGGADDRTHEQRLADLANGLGLSLARKAAKATDDLSGEAKALRQQLQQALNRKHSEAGAARYKDLWNQVPRELRREVRGKVPAPSKKSFGGRRR